MLLIVEEGIRGGICHSIHRYAKANNKYMKNYNKTEESSYIQYLDAFMSKNLPVNESKWLDSNKINEEFTKNYNENDKKGYIIYLVCNLYNKKKYVVHMNSLKQALNHGLKFKKIH